ncbi:MAG: hypothetical protein WAU88_01075, partial [Candidatus Zixiibacteriota bacterium]
MRRSLSLAPLVVAMVLFGLATGCKDKSSQPATPSFGPDGSLYVLNQQDGSLYIYDSKTLARTDSLAAQVPAPHHLEFSPDHS